MFFDIGKIRMKRKTIWKKIAKMVSWFKFFIEKKRKGKFCYAYHPH